jgi:CRISPR/Cas system-associated protein Cas10 (large subunit of type III CRISPR-Cas system)
MAKDTNRYGEPISKVSLEDAIDEFSKWSTNNLITCCASLMVTHHAEEFDELVKKLRKELGEGSDDEISIIY